MVMVTRTRADDARVPTEPMREYHAAGLGEAHRDRMDRRSRASLRPISGYVPKEMVFVLPAMLYLKRHHFPPLG